MHRCDLKPRRPPAAASFSKHMNRMLLISRPSVHIPCTFPDNQRSTIYQVGRDLLATRSSQLSWHLMKTTNAAHNLSHCIPAYHTPQSQTAQVPTPGKCSSPLPDQKYTDSNDGRRSGPGQTPCCCLQLRGSLTWAVACSSDRS